LITGNRPVSADDDKLFTVTPEQVATDLESDFNKVENFLTANEIGPAREQLSLIKFNIAKNRRFIQSDTVAAYNGRIATFYSKAQQKVDSLVKVNLAIVEKNGSSAGYEYRQYLAIQAGVHETELLPVDNAIAERAEKNTGNKTPEENQRQEATAPAGALSPDEAQTQDETERERATALSTAAKIRGLLSLGNVDEAFTVFQIHEQYLRKYLVPDQFSTLKVSIDSTSSQQQKSRAKATEKAGNIERLLDRDKVTDAFAELQDERESLKKSLDPEEMRLLEKKVGQAYTAFLQKQASANRTMRDIRDFLAVKNAENAYGLFELWKTELERYLRPDAFKILQEEVMKAYCSVLDKKKLCARVQHDVLLLCKNGNAEDAGNLFAGNQVLLQQYLLSNDYAALQGDVGKAKREMGRQRTQAESDAAAIESLLAGQRIQAAWSLFDKRKEFLKKYLVGKTSFPELKECVVNAYDNLREAQSKALQASNKLVSLCNRNEGRKAYALFKQEAPELRKYCAPKDYTRLESRVTIAKAAYDAKQNAARNACARINGLLSQKQVVRAHAEYRNAEDDLSFYLADDPAADSLQKRESRDWNAWQERNRRASSTVRQINGLISERKGNFALAQLRSSRAELQNYIEPPTLAKLDVDAARADREYSAKKAQAERSTALVLSLLNQNKIEDASMAFDTLENDLRFYSAPEVFDDLRTRVESSNRLLQGKKSEAQKVITAINNLIADERGDSANTLFIKNANLLRNYSAGSAYKKTSERVAQAKQAYEKNVREAGVTASRLKTMAQHSLNAEAAYDQFKYERGYFAHYLDKSNFASLETSLRTSHDSFMERRKESHVIVTGLKRMLRDRQYTIAKSMFDQNNKQLACYLPTDEYMEIMTNVTVAYTNSIHGRSSANATAGKIRELLAEGKVIDAYTAFKESRSMLEQYLPEIEFTGIKTEVTAACEEREKKTGKAKEYAKMIKQHIEKKQTTEAYHDFKQNRTELNEYLDAQTYADLETTVMNAYEQADGKSGDE
jgi:hypothetical protein